MAMLKLRTIKRTSVFVALAPTVVVMAGMVFIPNDPRWIVPVGVAVFVVSFVSSEFFLRKYIAFRIKPVYENFFSRNFKTRDLDREGVVRHIESEIYRRQDDDRREITRLKATEQYRKEFLGNVSHELKTPVFNIQGYIATLLDGALHDPEVNDKYLRRAEKSVERMINIITDLEQISRLESGSLVLDIAAFDIVALAREIAEAQEMLGSRRGIHITIGSIPGHDHEPIMVLADRKHIGQVLVNLVTNSIRYGNEGGLTEIAFIDMFDRVLVEVSDNGIGISKHDQLRIFERFFRIDKGRSRETGGTGLGLSIVKHIVEAHGESITVRSQPGAGSTFTFTLKKA